MLDLNYRVYENNSSKVGWPTPNATCSNTLYKWVADNALNIRSWGYTAVNFPPSTKGAAGPFSDGYDQNGDNYDLGTTQNPTAFGTTDQLRRAVAAVHSAGMQAYGDLVLHQYDGFDPSKEFLPLNYAGKPLGRFPKLPSYFVGPPPGVNVDPVPDSQGNFGFGAMASYINSTPKGEMLKLTSEAADWLAETIGFDGFRIDDTKGTNVSAVLAVLNSPTMSNKFAFGEYFDGNNTNLWNWVHNEMEGRSSCLDFNFKFNIGNICNNNSRAWMGAMDGLGYCSVDSTKSVTFTESADTDNSPGEQIIWNKMMGYAAMLTFPGYPRVYYRDMASDPNCYGMMEHINNLIYIHENFANGNLIPRWTDDPQVYIMEREGYNGQPGCIVGFNNDQYNEYTRTVYTTLGANQRLHEYTGKYGDVWTDWEGKLTFTLPKNDNGLGYLVFAKWVEPKPYPVMPIFTSQTIYGAVDLKVPPIELGEFTIGQITIEKDTWLTLSISLDVKDWLIGDLATLSVTGTKDTKSVATIDINTKTSNGTHGISITETDTYVISITSNVAVARATPFSVNLYYIGA
jgi:alpha-amylase